MHIRIYNVIVGFVGKQGMPEWENYDQWIFDPCSSTKPNLGLHWDTYVG